MNQLQIKQLDYSYLHQLYSSIHINAPSSMPAYREI